MTHEEFRKFRETMKNAGHIECPKCKKGTVKFDDIIFKDLPYGTAYCDNPECDFIYNKN